jgi:hypothetical protein
MFKVRKIAIEINQDGSPKYDKILKFKYHNKSESESALLRYLIDSESESEFLWDDDTKKDGAKSVFSCDFESYSLPRFKKVALGKSDFRHDYHGSEGNLHFMTIWNQIYIDDMEFTAVYERGKDFIRGKPYQTFYLDEKKSSELLVMLHKMSELDFFDGRRRVCIGDFKPMRSKDDVLRVFNYIKDNHYDAHSEAKRIIELHNGQANDK